MADDFVFSYETRVGEAALIPEGLKCCLGRRMGLARLHKHRVNPRFFLYQYRSPQFQEFLHTKTIHGATVDRISIKEFPAYPVFLPSLDTQRRITAILDEAFEGIATARANSEMNSRHAQELFEDWLHKLFNAGREHWTRKRLGETGSSISTGPFGTMLHKADYVADGTPLINPMNIVGSKIMPSAKMMVSRATKERLATYVLRKGDVVIARRGELGRCAVITEAEDGWLCGTGSFFVRLSKLIDEQYFVMLFGSRAVKAILKQRSIGTTMSNLNHGILNELDLFLPPVEEQREIVARADELRTEIERLSSNCGQRVRQLEEL